VFALILHAHVEVAFRGPTGEDGPMSACESVPLSEEYVAATEQAFTRCPTFRGLRLLSAGIRHGLLTVRFEGPMDDHRGPYGVVMRLPEAQPEPVASTGNALPGDVEDWAHGDLTIQVLGAYASSLNQERPYSHDGVWWLTGDWNLSQVGP
jgi:hypothetical protein